MMDRYAPSSDFQPGPAPQSILKRSETPGSSSVPDGALAETSRQSNPCSAIENWTSSDSRNPGMMVAGQHPSAVEATSSYSMGPSHPSVETVADGLSRMYPYDQGWSSSFMGPSSIMAPLQPALRRSYDYNGTEGRTFNPDPSLYASSRAHVSPANQPEASGTNSPPTAVSPSSSPLSICSHHSGDRNGERPSSFGPRLGVKRENVRNSPDTEEEGCAGAPYSLLIYQALRNAPGMKLPLQGIYSWFMCNTIKGKDRNSKGWQNSIRHNLSMNAGFEAVREESMPGKRSVNYWRLTDEAIKNGIQSTTRYRKQANYKKTLASDPPAPQRQRSGARGGKATRIAAKFRGPVIQDGFDCWCERDDLLPPWQRRYKRTLRRGYPTPPPNDSTHVSGPSAPLTRQAVQQFDLGSVVGSAAPPPSTPVFYDVARPSVNTPAVADGYMGWCVIRSWPRGILTDSETSSINEQDRDAEHEQEV